MRWAIEPLGDSAALVECADETAAAQFAAALRADRPPWLIDVVLAYQTVAAYFDLLRVGFTEVSAFLQKVRPSSMANATASNLHTIPCCYELGPDLAEAAALLKLTPDEVIRQHTAQPLRVFAIGFSPGFPYLGYLPVPLRGLARLPAPRKRVEAGSVAIVGKQACVYPTATPGGWRLIGRTPCRLVDLEDEYFPLRPGDFVRFVAIDVAEHGRRQGERLDPPVPASRKNVEHAFG